VRGKPPEVIFVEVNNFVDLYIRHVFENLKPYADRDGMDLKAYYPDVMGRFTRDGGVYAIPQDTAPAGLMYYNKKMFDEAGLPYPTGDWSWPEPFLSICKKLTKKDKTGKVVRWAYSEDAPVQFVHFMFSNGGNWVDDTDHPTRFTMDTPQVLEAARFRYDLINKYHVSPGPPEVQAFAFGNNAEYMFMNGQLAMMSSGIWQTPRLLEKEGFEFDVVEFPKGPSGHQGWPTGGSGFAMSSGCKNKDLAWKVIRELTNEITLSRLTATGMIQPSLMAIAESDAFLKSPGPAHKSILLKMPQYSHYTPFMPNWFELQFGAYGPAMDPVWIGLKTPEEVLPNLTRDINKKYFGVK